MSIQKQKVLRFIPIVNFFVCVFSWLKMYRVKNIKQADFLRAMLIMFLVMLLLTLPRIILSVVFKNDMLDSIVFYISLYFYLFGISAVAVADQEHHMNQSQ